MKRTIMRLLAIATVLATLCVGLIPCHAASKAPYDVYMEYLTSLDEPYDFYEYEDKAGQLVQVEVGITTDTAGASVLVWGVITEDASTGVGRVLSIMQNGTDSYTYLYYDVDIMSQSVISQGYGTATAEELNSGKQLNFAEYLSETYAQEQEEKNATELVELWVVGLGELVKEAGLTATDFGFSGGNGDLGGAFSIERWIYAGEMTLLGMGMVFLVLAILWGVLGIFKVCLYHPDDAKPVKEAKPAPVVAAPAPAPVQPAAGTDDGALLAVITAAVAAAMEEEGTTPSGGFRVVSFTKTTKRGGPWNG